MSEQPESMVERVANEIQAVPVAHWRRNKINDRDNQYEVFTDNPNGIVDPKVIASFSNEQAARNFAFEFTWNERARAAIRAMREPTDYMLRSMYAAKAVCQIGDNPTEVARYAYGNKYTAAIDAALEGK